MKNLILIFLVLTSCQWQSIPESAKFQIYMNSYNYDFHLRKLCIYKFEAIPAAKWESIADIEHSSSNIISKSLNEEDFNSINLWAETSVDVGVYKGIYLRLDNFCNWNSVEWQYAGNSIFTQESLEVIFVKDFTIDKNYKYIVQLDWTKLFQAWESISSGSQLSNEKWFVDEDSAVLLELVIK